MRGPLILNSVRNNIKRYDTSLRAVIKMKANKFFLVTIADFFDSNSQGTNFDIPSNVLIPKRLWFFRPFY